MMAALRRVFRKIVQSNMGVGTPTVLQAWPGSSDSPTVIIPLERGVRGAFVLCATEQTADAIIRAVTGDEPVDDLPPVVRRGRVLHDLARMVVNVARRDARLNRVALGSPRLCSVDSGFDLLQGLQPWVTIPISTDVGPLLVGTAETAPTPPQAKAPAEQAALEGVV